MYKGRKQNRLEYLAATTGDADKVNNKIFI